MTDRMSAERMIEMSRERGFAAQQLFAIFTYPVNGMDLIIANGEDHLKHQIAIEEEGVLFGAGPLFTDDGQYVEGEGMIIIRAASLAEAQAIADRDPMHKSGARRYRIRPWLLNEGRQTVSVSLSNGAARLI